MKSESRENAHSAAPLEERIEASRGALEIYARRLKPAGQSAHAIHIDHEDLVQETMARALKWGSRFDESRPVLPWLKQTLLRVFLSHQKRAMAACLEPLVESAAIEAPSVPHAALEAVDEAEFLLAQLEEPEREVMERFHRREQSIQQIAGALSLPEGTVKSHLYRARRRLAEFDEAGGLSKQDGDSR